MRPPAQPAHELPGVPPPGDLTFQPLLLQSRNAVTTVIRTVDRDPRTPHPSVRPGAPRGVIREETINICHER